MLRASDVRFDYGAQPVLDGASLELRDGELLGIVGPNGAGKSTLLACLHGGLRPRSGTIELEGRALATFSRREVAQRIGVVPQRCEIAFPIAVRSFVGLGRFAHQSWLATPTPRDRATVERALSDTDVGALADRAVNELSGGEFRRVLVAQALAQEPRILLFDEPVQQLDLLHQLEVMELARSFTRTAGRAAAIVLHDLALAARYCDRLVLLHAGRVVAAGAPRDVLTVERVESVWSVHVAIERSTATDAIHVVPLARAGSVAAKEAS